MDSYVQSQLFIAAASNDTGQLPYLIENLAANINGYALMSNKEDCGVINVGETAFMVALKCNSYRVVKKLLLGNFKTISSPVIPSLLSLNRSNVFHFLFEGKLKETCHYDTIVTTSPSFYDIFNMLVAFFGYTNTQKYMHAKNLEDTSAKDLLLSLVDESLFAHIDEILLASAKEEGGTKNDLEYDYQETARKYHSYAGLCDLPCVKVSNAKENQYGSGCTKWADKESTEIYEDIMSVLVDQDATKLVIEVPPSQYCLLMRLTVREPEFNKTMKMIDAIKCSLPKNQIEIRSNPYLKGRGKAGTDRLRVFWDQGLYTVKGHTPAWAKTCQHYLDGI